MAAGSGSSQQNLRKAILAIRDSTKVGIAKVNSEYKDLKVSILKATNHLEVLPKEKHVRNILGAVSGSRPRADVGYCIHTLTRRLGKTRNWVVALKTLIVIHRALREVDHSFCEELIYHNQGGGHLLNLSHFRDDSSPSAWDYSTWIRSYALYIEECLECFRVLKYDFHRDHTRTKKFDTPALLEHLPALQQLLFRLLGCQPVGAARYNFIIQYALSIVAAESVRLYVGITDGVLILVDKFFEMQRRDAVKALEIYRRAGEQAQKLSGFFEMCRSLEFGRKQKYVKIEQAPASFLTAMEEYVKDAPEALLLPWRGGQLDDDNYSTPKVIVVPGANVETDSKQDINEEGSNPYADCQEGTKTEKRDTDAAPLIPDLLSWDEPSQEESKQDAGNSLPDSIITPDLSDPTISSELSSQSPSWELALATVPVVEPSSYVCLAAPNKGGVLDRSILDSLYDTAVMKANTNGPYQIANVSSNPFEADDYNQEMFYDPSRVGHPSFMQVQQAAFMQQQAAPQQSQAVVPFDYMQIAGITQPQQPALVQNQDSSFTGDDFMQMIPMPQPEVSMMMQQQDISMVGIDSSNPFGNPFMEQVSLPVSPQSQPSTLSLL
ncbi:putative clathrin assembly protein At5g35200 isoform X2 [Sesamum indicum]|uniref:Clathrin assembly protein At5g35200 isoform X2 n=1 Tax=Sesamum indicum TaxID=4182 RepID=A0A8M8UZ94_SESIN|nr:putative clathrin assembly protein At5g35200 isoform X2 [Sesamum indicum]